MDGSRYSRDGIAVKKKAGWAIAALIVANEVRGVIVAATIGWPMLKAMF
jgi:hypothetical protein